MLESNAPASIAAAKHRSEALPSFAAQWIGSWLTVNVIAITLIINVIAITLIIN
jgi:hypothetical protein